MATNPGYAATPLHGAAVLTALETDLQVPTQAVSVIGTQTNGAKIEEIVVEAIATTLIATTVAGLVYIWIYNGSTYFLYDVIPVTAVTASATGAGFRLSKSYNNLILESTESLYAGNSVAGNDSKLVVHAFGGAY